ncbi:MAG TPA: DUF2442 domain-containing protein [Bacteroidota bacterium]|nr:DUF2442 domain-containing protein [Bacteroidota bacterium]
MANKNKFHEVENIRFSNKSLIIRIDGKEHRFSLEDISQRLLKASKIERETFAVDQYGYGIRWNLIDEDLSIDGLLNLTRPSQRKKEKLLVYPRERQKFPHLTSS